MLFFELRFPILLRPCGRGIRFGLSSSGDQGGATGTSSVVCGRNRAGSIGSLCGTCVQRIADSNKSDGGSDHGGDAPKSMTGKEEERAFRFVPSIFLVLSVRQKTKKN